MTQPIDRLRDLFDAALGLREQHRNEEAIASLRHLVDLLDDSPEQRRLFAHSHIQIAHIYKRLGNHVRREHHLQIAVAAAPRLELASLALFHALVALDRFEEALKEMVRFVEGSNSEGYRELLSEGYGDDLAPAARELADTARALLARFT